MQKLGSAVHFIANVGRGGTEPFGRSFQFHNVVAIHDDAFAYDRGPALVGEERRRLGLTWVTREHTRKLVDR